MGATRHAAEHVPGVGGVGGLAQGTAAEDYHRIGPEHPPSGVTPCDGLRLVDGEAADVGVDRLARHLCLGHAGQDDLVVDAELLQEFVAPKR
jgi:hypothetical protein